jgi:hypothetical protein
MKAGADFVRTQSNILNVPSDLGHYFFGSTGLNGDFNSFATEPTSGPTNAIGVLQAFPDVKTNGSGAITGQRRNELPLRENDPALFIQNDFHVRSNVTLSGGLRYERFGQPINGILCLNPAPGNNIPVGHGDFGPRFGIAWSPGAGRTIVFRGGYALMYDQMPLNIPLLIWQSTPISPTVATITPAGAALEALSGVTLPATGDYPHSPLTWQAVNGMAVSGCGRFTSQVTAGTVPLVNCSTQNKVAPNLVAPYIQTWSMEVQRELSRNIMVEVNYVGTKGTKTYQRVDQNPYGGWNAAFLRSGLARVV